MIASLPPWALVQEIFLRLLLPAAAAAGAGAALACWLGRRRPALAALGAALALVAGWAAGNAARSLLEWGDAAETGWRSLLPVGAAAAVAGALLSGLGGRLPARALALARLVICAAASWVLAEPLETASLAAVRAGLALVGWLSWEALDRASDRLPRSPALLLTVPWGLGMAAVLIFSHSARFHDLAMLMTAAAGAAGLAAWPFPASASALRGLAAAPCVWIPALAVAGYGNTFSEVPPAAFVLAGAAPLALWILPLLPPRRTLLLLAAALALAAPLASAVGMAAWAEDLEYGEE